MVLLLLFLFKQKTAYGMRISDWSSDVCSSDLGGGPDRAAGGRHRLRLLDAAPQGRPGAGGGRRRLGPPLLHGRLGRHVPDDHERRLPPRRDDGDPALRSEERSGGKEGVIT